MFRCCFIVSPFSFLYLNNQLLSAVIDDTVMNDTQTFFALLEVYLLNSQKVDPCLMHVCHLVRCPHLPGRMLQNKNKAKPLCSRGEAGASAGVTVLHTGGLCPVPGKCKRSWGSSLASQSFDLGIRQWLIGMRSALFSLCSLCLT